MVYNLQKVETQTSSTTTDTAVFELFGQEYKVEKEPRSPGVAVTSNRRGIPIFKVPSQPSELDVNQEHIEEIVADVIKYQRHRLCGIRMGKRTATYLLWSGLVLGHLGQNITLPAFADHLCLNCMTSTYFVAFFTAAASAAFLLPFAIVSRVLQPDPPVQHLSHASQVVVGFLTACGLLLRAYTAPSNKVSPIFQAIASSVAICFSVRLYAALKEEYITPKDAVTCLLVVFGLLVAMVPTWSDPLCGVDRGVVWPLICLFGWLPKALLNVLEEWHFVGVCHTGDFSHPQPPAPTPMNTILGLFWSNLYALAFLLAFFWTDMLPIPFGLGSTFGEFLSMLQESVYCYVSSRPQCPHLAFWATLYVASVLFTALCGTLVQEHVFMRLSMAAAALYTPLSVFAWLGYYASSSGAQELASAGTMYVLALIPILCATVMHGVTRASVALSQGQPSIGCLDRAMTDDRYVQS